MKFDRDSFLPTFINDQKKQEVHFENPYILISEKKINLINDIIPSLKLLHVIVDPC